MTHSSPFGAVHASNPDVHAPPITHGGAFICATDAHICRSSPTNKSQSRPVRSRAYAGVMSSSPSGCGAGGPPSAMASTWSIGKSGPQSQWPPPQLPRSLCWQTPRPLPCASAADSRRMGMPNAPASSAIHAAVLASIVGCRCHSAASHDANAQSSICTATGLALDAVHALRSRVTYSPTVLGVSSAPVWELTPLDELAKKLPSDWMVSAPSAVCRTMSRTPAPPRELLFGDGIHTRLRLTGHPAFGRRRRVVCMGLRCRRGWRTGGPVRGRRRGRGGSRRATVGDNELYVGRGDNRRGSRARLKINAVGVCRRGGHIEPRAVER